MYKRQAFARGNIGKAKSLASSADFDNIKNEALSLLKYIQDMDLSEILSLIHIYHFTFDETGIVFCRTISVFVDL